MIPLKIKWLIPMAFAGLCGLLMVVSMGAQFSQTAVLTKKVNLELGGEQTWPVELDPDKMYTIKITPPRVAIGHSYDVSAELAMNDQVIFALDDSYWHQTGRWREGGESGTWDENNSSTEFNFRVTEKGKHDVTLSLGAAVPIGSAIFQAEVLESSPLPFGWWPFFFGGLLFGIIGIYMFFKRGTYFALSLFKYDVGTKFKIDDMEYLVDEISDYFYMHEHWSTEFKLRGTDGSTRYLSSDRFEVEGEESTTTYHQVLMDIPLTPEETAELQQQTGMRQISLRGSQFVFDDDNSGMATQVIVKHGTPYRNRVDSNLFHDAYKFPRKAGEIWIDYTSINNDEAEWTVQQIMKWNKIRITEAVPRKGPAFSPNDVTEHDAGGQNPSVGA